MLVLILEFLGRNVHSFLHRVKDFVFRNPSERQCRDLYRSQQYLALVKAHQLHYDHFK